MQNIEYVGVQNNTTMVVYPVGFVKELEAQGLLFWHIGIEPRLTRRPSHTTVHTEVPLISVGGIASLTGRISSRGTKAQVS